MAADLSALSTEDLVALKGGDLSKVSTAGLQALKGLQARPSAAEQVRNDPISTGARAAAGATPAELIAGSAPGRFLLEPARGLLELGSHLGLPGGEAAQQTGELIKGGRAAYGDTGLDVAGIAGQVASPAVLKAGKLIPAGANLLQKSLGSAATGATAGALTPTQGESDTPLSDMVTGKQPRDFWKEKALQTGTGAAVGAVLPPAGALAKGLFSTVHKAFEPILPGGPEAILGRFQDKLVGPAKDKIIQALLAAKQLVPGSAPTAGEAVAGIPEASALAAHQQAVSRAPAVSGQFVARAGEQEGARAAAVGRVAQNKELLDFAKQVRSEEATKNYGTAGKEIIKTDRELQGLLAKPSMKTVLGRATDLAKERGDTFKLGQDLPAKLEVTPASSKAGLLVDEHGKPLMNTVVPAKVDFTPAQVSSYPVKSLHYIKMAMDDLLKNPERFGIGASEAQAIGGTRAKFVDWLGQRSPAYDFARQEFAAMSRPINAMEVGQTLETKLHAPLPQEGGHIERAASFAQALRDAPRTIKTATGASRFDELRQILTPQQAAAMEAVGSDLGRKAQFERLARGTNLGGAGMQPENLLPNLLSRPAMAANWIAKKLGHNLEERVTGIAGQQYLDPAKLAAALADKPLSVRKRLVDELLQRTGYPVVSGGPASAIAQQY